ncbi:hypothetical protein BC834DRAFT_215474 [Gloeopeniophorella convolvens]|nr:hypothetical protein BC834DRAFT_215474 [Gloeopeniophorella convolvens]
MYGMEELMSEKETIQNEHLRGIKHLDGARKDTASFSACPLTLPPSPPVASVPAALRPTVLSYTLSGPLVDPTLFASLAFARAPVTPSRTHSVPCGPYIRLFARAALFVRHVRFVVSALSRIVFSTPLTGLLGTCRPNTAVSVRWNESLGLRPKGNCNQRLRCLHGLLTRQENAPPSVPRAFQVIFHPRTPTLVLPFSHTHAKSRSDPPPSAGLLTLVQSFSSPTRSPSFLS